MQIGLREKIKCMIEKRCEAGKNKGLRVKTKGTRAKEKSEKVKRGIKVADSAQGQNRMHEGFFLKNMQGDN